ncbi:CoA-acylating methylmalonate-semialdehyde dehydrogenase [Campylobacter sp. MIT 21-1685]|uniref:CoA-acylating methylmalonate-semialdehyde dehydrogenase n=1 Tax=unclassified Campylobacter TaxID=2593542 RepID=UPI00224B3472|nr:MULTISPECIES: CoA-acylating methylmalonate-semialdehyde dehydrogenase [unclassified Campylobacter]MCX2682504.1 CoA-acylating methylmalonate-semialdehyde dehydrogenase [Campylobacter sp. MIT 21-1684]MCX2750783.1 CoA-acylating methylmalonate-semialdehyde dehydrogenase [Campylobacter sp. MIT 21-1682]MCX2806985.1 CoA-acylating methylmalonate-semialdehyde dehydrogenase [Campylobacter sp. MIT 21-1685]
MNKLKALVDGQFIESKSDKFVESLSPLTGEVLVRVPCMLKNEIDRAVHSAHKAFLEYRDTPIMTRVRAMLQYQALLKENLEQLATILAKEQGKTLDDAKGDIVRGYEVVEFACSAPTLLMGETVENVSKGINTFSYKQALGVCAGITPFNFPGMIPLWMFPLAIVCGNAFILKPSELVPQTAMRLAELFLQCDVPKGILQVVHGQKEQVDMLLDHPLIKAYSFVGSPAVGAYIYSRASANLKRAQALVGAKNHMVIMPDADEEKAVNALIGSSMGAAGQRCMATSVVIFVGEAKKFIKTLLDRLKSVKPGAYNDPKAAYGPLISNEALERVKKIIESGIEEGATLALDGRGITIEGYPNGNWLGPCVFTNVNTNMQIYKKEIFAPVLCVLEVQTLNEAINIINTNEFGNGTSIFTNSLSASSLFVKEISVGQVGVNVPIPVPLPFFSFTGWKGSFYGDLHAYGKQAVTFYTETKTVTQRYFTNEKENIIFNFEEKHS